MKWWKKWSRRIDAWVERGRRFQERVARAFDYPGQRVPALVTVPVRTGERGSRKTR